MTTQPKALSVFNFQSNDVRVATDEKGEPWFLANDVLFWLDSPKLIDCTDATRIDWLQTIDEDFYNIDRISAVVGVGFNTRQSLREAIDLAMIEKHKNLIIPRK